MQQNNHLIKALPKGGYNKGIVVTMISSCPPDCSCKGQQIKNWHHLVCGDPAFINQYGDIFCKNFLESEQCDGYFLQFARFQCEGAKVSKTLQQSAAKMLMTQALGMQAAELQLDDNAYFQFSTILLEQVQKRRVH